jgi:release factor glutamine methyltransferase
MSLELAYQQLVSSLQTIYENREASTMANWVIEKLTGLNRVDRLINKHQSISDSNKLLLKKITEELLAHRPIQYVLGEAWFLKKSFFVNESVLIPRPETEELVDWIVTENAQMLGIRILDIGSGSGCIPITLKKQIPASEIISVDISTDAIAVATKNAIDLGASVRFLTMDFLNENNWNDLPQTDIIVSNPPYIKLTEKASMAQHVLDFEPSVALFVPDNDALIFYRAIAKFGKSHLSGNGTIYFEINEALGAETMALLDSNGYYCTLKKDMQGKDRMIKAQLID